MKNLFPIAGILAAIAAVIGTVMVLHKKAGKSKGHN